METVNLLQKQNLSYANLFVSACLI